MTQKSLFYGDLILEEANELIKNGEDVNEKCGGDYAPLHFIQNVEIAQLLIDHGADVNAQNDIGKTPLHLSKNIDITNLLIMNGADVNIIDKYGSIPLLDHSAKITNKKMVELFIKAGTNLNKKSHFGSVLSTLSQCDVDPSIPKLCIEHGALASDIKAYKKFHKLFTPEQQNAFDSFLLLTSNDDDFFQMCLAYQNNKKNIKIKDMDII